MVKPAAKRRVVQFWIKTGLLSERHGCRLMGVSRSTLRPVYVDGKLEPRLIMPFSFSYDHRVIDGVAAAEFTKALGEVLTDIRELIL